MSHTKAYLSVAAGAVLWGTIGIFIKGLTSYGFTPLEMVWLRAISAVFFFFIWMVFYNKRLFVIAFRDCFYFLGTGICSVAFFNWCYFSAIEYTSLSTAAVLLYTAPAFVLLMSKFVFQEKITLRKGMGIFFTFIGCLFVVGFLPSLPSSFSFIGLFYGLGAGFGYSMYSIFAKLAAKKYHPLTISFYTFVFTSVSLFPFTHEAISRMARISVPPAIFLIVGLGLLPTVLAYWFYTRGLARLQPGNAAIVSYTEPAVATLIGSLLYKESFSIWQGAGIILILVVLFLIKGDKTQNESTKLIA